MPLFKSIHVRESRLLGIWHIEESFHELLKDLSPSEQDKNLLESYRSEHKRLEWLCGRLTLRHLATQLGLEYNGVVKDEHGKPSLRGHNHEISLTHSYPYVAAIIDPTQDVGIDLEQPNKDKIIRIAPKFLQEEELEFAKNDVLTLYALWCAKETLYKIQGKNGVIFREHLYIEPYDRLRDSILHGSIIVNNTVSRHDIALAINEDYILTYNI